MNKNLYNIYKNILIFTSDKYRNYELLKPNDKNKEYVSIPNLKRDEFSKIMQKNEYILINGKKKNEKTLIYILIINYNSKYSSQTSNMLKILKKIYNNSKTDVFIFTDNPLTIYIRKSFKQFPIFNFHNYLFKHFIIEIHKGPLCSKGCILSEEKFKEIQKYIKTDRLSLPKIKITDPQVIWLGAEIGQVIEFTPISPISGVRKSYRVVVPDVNW